MIRILDYSWHQVHSYRLHALPAEFTYAIFRYPIWNELQRPVPQNFVGALLPDEIDAREFDLALLHLDQWCDTSNNIRALPYRLMNQIAQDIPRVVIMHGTPDSEENRRSILGLIGDLPVVCNSFRAAAEWDGGEGRRDCYGLPQFRTIIHGYDADEFWSNELETRRREIVTVCSGGNISREYHGLPLVERLKRDVPLAWYGPRGDRPWLPDYISYRRMLASSLIYFSPTRRAPMPGARTEAMLSGCCVVTVPGNDVERYIEDEKTGFIVVDYEEAHAVLLALLDNPASAWEIGQAGREVAREMFRKERFVGDWLRVLEAIGVC